MDAGTIQVVLEAVNKVSSETDKIRSDIQRMSREVEASGTAAGKGMDNAGRSAAAAGNQFSLSGKAMSAAMLAGGAAVAGAGVAVTSFVKGSISSFRDFDAGMREVFTLMPGISGAAMDQMKADVLSAADQMNVMPQEVIPALYQSLSAGVPPGNVFEFLEVANQAAKGGVTELATSVDALSSVVNAYGPEVISATEASDLMFTSVRLGKTTFEEMSASLANVTPLAAASGVAFEEVTAAVATITASGTPTAQAVTQIRAALVALNDPASEVSKVFRDLTGQTFTEFTAAGGSMTEALGMIRDHADATGINVQTLFGRLEGGMATLNLTGSNAEKAAGNLDAMRESAGATEAAFETMDAGVGSAMDDLAVKVETLKIQAGEQLAPALVGFVDVLNADLIPALAEARDGFQEILDIVDPLANVSLPALSAVNEKTGGTAGKIAKEYGLLLALGPGVAIFRGANMLLGDSVDEVNEKVEVSSEVMDLHGQSVESLTKLVEENADATEELAPISDELVDRIQAQKDTQDALAISYGQVGDVMENYAAQLDLTRSRAAAAADSTNALDQSLDGLAGAYAAANDIQSVFSQQGSDYSSTASSMEKALEELQKRQAEGNELTDEQIRFMEDAGVEIQRMEEAAGDAAIQEGMAARVKSELKHAQDELNEARAGGVEDLSGYEAALADAEQAAADLGIETGNEQSVMENLASVLENTLAPAIDGLIKLMTDLGLIKAEPEVDLLGEELALEGIGDIEREIGLLPDSFTVTANVDIAPAMASIAQLDANMPHSPAREGPLSVAPNWDWLFEGLPEAAEDAIDRLQTIFARISPVFQTAMDALDDPEVYDRLVEEIEKLFEWKKIAEDIGLGQEVVDAIQAQIEAKQAELEQVGQIMGVMVGDAFISTLSDADIQAIMDAWHAQIDADRADRQADIISGLPSLEEIFNGDAIQKAIDDIMELEARRDALAELGLDTTDLDEQIQAIADQIIAMQHVKGTEAAQAWWASYQEQLADEEQRKIAEETMAELTENQLAVLAEHFESGEEVTADHIQKLLDAIAVGAITMDEAMALIAKVPQEELIPILAELEEILGVDIVNAILAGDQAAEDAANGGMEILLQIIELLGLSMEDLADATEEASDSFDELGSSATTSASRVARASTTISSSAGSTGGGSSSSSTGGNRGNTLPGSTLGIGNGDIIGSFIPANVSDVTDSQGAIHLHALNEQRDPTRGGALGPIELNSLDPNPGGDLLKDTFQYDVPASFLPDNAAALSGTALMRDIIRRDIFNLRNAWQADNNNYGWPFSETWYESGWDNPDAGGYTGQYPLLKIQSSNKDALQRLFDVAKGLPLTVYRDSVDGYGNPRRGVDLYGDYINPFFRGGITQRPTIGLTSEFNQREAIIPLEGRGIDMIVDTLLERIISRAGSGSAGPGGEIHNHFYVNGKEVATAVADDFAGQFERGF